MLADNWYGMAAIMSLVCFGSLFALNWLVVRGWILAPFRRIYQLNYLLIAFALVAVVAFEGTKSPLDLLAVKVEVQTLINNLSGPAQTVVQKSVSSLPEQPLEVVPIGPFVSYVLLWFFFIGAVFFVCRDVVEYLQLRQITRSATVIHDIRHVRLAVADNIAGAFSWHGWRKAWVVIPLSYLSNSRLTRHAVSHELNHHRAGDTKLCYCDRLLIYLFWWNPLAHIWESSLNDLREFACDHDVIERRRFDPRQYCESLLKAASFHPFRTHHYVMGMAGQPESILSRRMTQMMETKAKPPGFGGRFWLVLVMVTATILGGALVATAAVEKLGFSDEIGERLQATFNDQATVQIHLNDEVRKWLKHFIGTKEGRRHMEISIRRYRQIEATILQAIEQHEMPKELIAVAMIESAFGNPPQEHNRARSAGVWQFIPNTARRFSLVVKEGTDERLDVALASDAAMRYLKKLYLQFGSWPLAIIAYNGGERKLAKGIQEIGSRDPWKLLAAGYGGDPGYLAKYMAGAMALHYYEVL